MKVRLLLLLLLVSASFNAVILFRAHNAPRSIRDISLVGLQAPTPMPLVPQAVPNGSMPVELFRWRQIESADYHVYLKNLQDIGCPAETIRDIIIADVNKIYRQKRAALPLPKNTSKPWQKPSAEHTKSMTDRRVSIVQLESERLGVLRQLLGAIPQRELGPPLTQDDDVNFAFLPDGKKDTVATLLNGFRQRQEDLSIESVRTGQPVNPEQLRQLQQERYQALTQVMSPSEFEEFLFRTHPRGENLRNNLVSFQPTEEEFRFIFNLARPIDDKYEFNDLSNPEFRNRRQAELSALNPQIAEFLGPDRYREYDRVWSADFRALLRWTDESGLPVEFAGKIHDVQAAYLQALRALDAKASPEEIISSGKQLSTERDHKLVSILGQAGWLKYRDSGLIQR